MNSLPATRDELRRRLYAAYASTHAGVSNTKAATPVLRHDILPRLPRDRQARIVDIGCGQGDLVEWLHSEGYGRARGIDISPEQVELAHQRGRSAVELGDFRALLAPGSVDVVIATDFLEHFDKFEVMEVLDSIRASLADGGLLLLRVPNAVSPFGGNYRHGDMTHECSFTARSTRQLAAATGFGEVSVHSCVPVVHGARSAARWALWKIAAATMKAVLIAETGVVRGHHVTQNVLVEARATSRPR